MKLMKNYGQPWYIYFSQPPKPLPLEFRQVNCTEEKNGLGNSIQFSMCIKRRDNRFQWNVIKIFFFISFAITIVFFWKMYNKMNLYKHVWFGDLY